jgi:hypothetical protein
MSCCPFILEIRESSGSTGSTRGGGVGTRLPASSLSPGRFQLQDTFRKFQVNEAWALIHSGCPWPVQNIGIPLGIACDNPKNIGRFPAVEPHMDSGGCHPGPEGYGWNVQIGVLPNRSMAPHLSGFCDWRGDSNSNLRGPMMQQLVPEKAAVRRPLDFLYRCLSLGMSFLRWTILKKCRERRDDRAGLKPCEPPGGEENRRRLAHAQVDGCGRIKPGGRHEGGGIGGIGIGARAVPIRFLAPGFV